MSGPSAGSAVDHYLVDTLLPALFPTATVLRGSPGTQVEQDVVSLQSTTVDDAQVCMGPQRRRDETMRVTLLISCTRPGDHTVQADADDAAWAMLSTLRDELRTATTPNLGGAVRSAEVSSYSLERAEDPELLTVGRNAAITVTLKVLART